MTIIDGGSAGSSFTPAPAGLPLYAQTYAAREPYITPAEYKASPTGVNVTTLVPGGTAEEQADALLQTIARASGWVDTTCNQVLAATVETAAGWFLIVDGQVRVPVDFSPIAAVTNVTFGVGTNATALDDLSSLIIDRKVVTVPAIGVPTRNGRAYVAVTYVSGFANSLTTTSTAAGAVALTVDNTLGIVPGMRLTVSDPGVTEIVTVAAVTANTLTLTAPLANAHANDVNVSALPDAIKAATVLLTTALIKTKSSESIVFASARQEPRVRATGDQGHDEQNDAFMMLKSFARVY